jgi:hypothetical protein
MGSLPDARMAILLRVYKILINMFWKIISDHDNTQIIIFNCYYPFAAVCKYKHNFYRYQILIHHFFLKTS